MDKKLYAPWHIRALVRIITLAYRFARIEPIRDLLIVTNGLRAVYTIDEYIGWQKCVFIFARKYKNQLKALSATTLSLYNIVSASFFFWNRHYHAACAELYKGCVYIIIGRNIASLHVIQVLIAIGICADLTVTYSIGQIIAEYIQKSFSVKVPTECVYIFAAIYTSMTFGLFAWNLIQGKRKKRSDE